MSFTAPETSPVCKAWKADWKLAGSACSRFRSPSRHFAARSRSSARSRSGVARTSAGTRQIKVLQALDECLDGRLHVARKTLDGTLDFRDDGLRVDPLVARNCLSKGVGLACNSLPSLGGWRSYWRRAVGRAAISPVPLAAIARRQRRCPRGPTHRAQQTLPNVGASVLR